ncbi:precorrin-6y C5,15-methyltransferase (decarboxylating) subunit CbiE [Lysobacter korlensis]|uniref:Precorrin-6y C5,15-methyltransferase (Decarboxylating) subunit CbiE n=1 Tax=Lysobacter korlensis TaxID=553636 RepID=A0ABV6RS19_9GAMM
MQAWLTVVGIGDDGFDGLTRPARRALFAATQVHGGERHLAMLPARVRAERRPWPKPFDVQAVLARRHQPTCVLASGDPMFYGVGVVLARCVQPDELRILPAPSSASLAAARLGWPLQEVEVVSLVARPLTALAAQLQPGTRLFVLSEDGHTPEAVARLLQDRGYGDSRMTVFEHLGGNAERRIANTARGWPRDCVVAALNLVALECIADPGAAAWPLCSGLPDEAYRHDGQITKRDVRAITLARLGPRPGELLWDVGAGSGSIGIEWVRAHPHCRAIAIEANEARQAMISHNRDALGAAALRLVEGAAPEALEGLPAPDAVFIGGGITAPGVLEACWSALRPGGRLVANAVTLEAELRVAQWRGLHGGRLTRISLMDAQPLGGFETWRAALPITLYDVVKP